jgi:iron complex outermembrane recepter protein
VRVTLSNLSLVLWLLVCIYSSPTLSEEILETIDVSEEEDDKISGITNFENPARKTPISIKSYDQKKMNRERVKRLADLSSVDAAVTDSYNSSGYWDIISIRGFTLDNRSNFQREGLPLNAETTIPLENKERVEVLKGISNLYAGAASPGGLINYVVKRPTTTPFQVLRTEWSQQNNQLVSLDVSRKWFRVNAAQENIHPLIRDTKGDRSLLSGAFKYQISENSLLEAEIEWSRRTQPSVPGFSLLGNKLPSVPDPNLNLNNQPWSKPVVFEGYTGSMKYSQILPTDWIASFTAGGQRLITDDRLAYPYGCSAEGHYDRFCSDGTFDLYDYRSENEKRETNNVKAQLEGKIKQEELTHHLSMGSWIYTAKDRMNRQAYNPVGEGSVDGQSNLPSDPNLTSEGTNRDSHHVDFFASDRIEFKNWNLWLGARHSRIKKRSQQTDGSRLTEYDQSFLLPWSALSYQFSHLLSYISYGEGIESFVTPNRVEYTNRGQYLPGIISRQWELGLKGNTDLPWSLAIFQIKRPVVTDIPPDYKIDGEIKQRGVEAALEETYHNWHFGISYMKLDVKRHGSTLLSQYNDRKPVNIPDETIRTFLGHDVAKIRGLRLDLRWTNEGRRAVLNDNSIMLPAWNKWDLAISYEKKSWNTQLFLENIFSRRYWKESPTQYGHVYLFPGADRKVTLAMQFSF